MKNSIIFVLYIGILSSCSFSEHKISTNRDSNQVKVYPQGFVAYRGLNISHWLSQVYGWSPRATFFTEEDVKLIKNLGFDHIRLPIDEDQMWNVDGSRITESFSYLKNAIEWCADNDLRIIVDLHILRSHHFNAGNGEGKMILWTDREAQKKFFSLWIDLQDFLLEYPNDILAYELLNEPAAPTAQEWNFLVASTISQIRKREPQRVIFVGSNRWQSLENIPLLELPKGDTNLVIAFHNYDPLLVTHHLATWTSYKAYKGAVHYPGLSACAAELKMQLDTTNAALMAEVNYDNKVYNAHVFDSLISIAVNRAKELNVSVYCGEFGCLANIDTAMRHLYYRDFVGVLNKYHIGRASWDYKGVFQIVGYDASKMQNTQKNDTAVIRILTQ